MTLETFECFCLQMFSKKNGRKECENSPITRLTFRAFNNHRYDCVFKFKCDPIIILILLKSKCSTIERSNSLYQQPIIIQKFNLMQTNHHIIKVPDVVYIDSIKNIYVNNHLFSSMLEFKRVSTVGLQSLQKISK